MWDLAATGTQYNMVSCCAAVPWGGGERGREGVLPALAPARARCRLR